MTSKGEPHTEVLFGLAYPIKAGVGNIISSSLMYLMFFLLIPPFIAYGYAVNLGRSVARDEEPPEMSRDGLASDAIPLLSLKLFIFLVWFIPLYIVDFSPTWWVLAYSAPLAYLNGALNAVYSAEGYPVEFRRVLRLCLSRHHLNSILLYAPAVAIFGVIILFLVEGSILPWLLLPLLFAYWIMASFSYRGLVYRRALEGGVFEEDSVKIKERWKRESKREPGVEEGTSHKATSESASVCPDCGNEVVREATFCNLCGTELVDTEATGTKSGGKDYTRCPDCGRELLREDSYCWRCGGEVAIREETREDGDTSDEGLCDDCGTEIKERASFCQNCGAEVQGSP